MGKHLLLMGAGHAHLETISRCSDFIQKGHAVTVIGPDDYHYYSGMGPGMLGGFYAPEHIRLPVRRMTERGGGAFVKDRVVKLEPDKRKVHLESGKQIEYDVASVNLGSVVLKPEDGKAEPGETVIPVKPIENLMAGRRRVLGLVHQGKSRIIVVGGGPAALEIAGNAWRAARQCKEAKGGHDPEITVLSGRRFLGHYPEKVAALARKSLEVRGIVINEDGYARRIEPDRIILENGDEFKAEVVFMALGTKPPKLFKNDGLPVGPEGGLSVNEYLQCTDYPELFGGGDCIHFTPRPLDRVGVYAVRQNPVLRENLMAALEGGGLKRFEPQAIYMLIFNMGDGTGLLWRDGFICMNRPAFWFKNWIDRRFIGRFQL